MISAAQTLALTAVALQSVGCDAAKAARIVRFLDERGYMQYGQPTDEAAETADAISEAQLLIGGVYDGWELSDKVVKVEKVLSPLEAKAVPAVYAIGLNYVEHALAFNYSIPTSPVIFYKNRRTIANPGEDVVVPKISTMPDYEAELAVVISKDLKDVTEDEALNYVLGYSITNDVSGRCWQDAHNGPDPGGSACPGNGGQWFFSKSFDSHMPFGPFLVRPDSLPTPDGKGLDITMHLNGERVQSDNTTGMIFSVAETLAFMSQGTTIEKGTVITMGTPSGVGEEWRGKDGLGPQGHLLLDGDVMTATIRHIGSLTNRVSAPHLPRPGNDVMV